MTIHDFFKVLRARWVIICVTIVVILLSAVAVNMLTTPLYEASTRLFVSTNSGTSVAEIYQGNRFSQERVTSYTELLKGGTLAQRTIDKLDLDMSADELQNNVRATSKADTVLIDVAVIDESPVRARDIADALSDEFVNLARELETPRGGGRPDARVVVEQRASIPDTPVVPRTNRNLIVGLAVGVALGIGLALLRDLLDNTVKDREALEEITGVGLVGSIPLDKGRRREATISFDNDHSPIAEAFRKLRTNLQFLAVDNPPRVIVVTSSLPNEGKSTTAINLALVLAEAEHNVVLIEGDLRRPRLDSYLGLVRSVGFSTVLTGRTTIEEALQKTRFSSLTVLTSGAIPPNPSELLGSQAAKKIIDELRVQFDYVIIDSSPLLAVTDAAILATAADGVLIMTRFGETRREQLVQAVSSLRHVNAPILGAVLTMTTMRDKESYSYYGDGAGAARSSSDKPNVSTRSRRRNRGSVFHRQSAQSLPHDES